MFNFGIKWQNKAVNTSKNFYLCRPLSIFYNFEKQAKKTSMNFLDILLIAVGLSMDAFAVSVGKGMAVPRANWRNALCVGIWFGGFQGLMPIIGFMLVSIFSNIPAIGNAISRTDHWIAFLMLALIGGNMIKEALSSKEEQFDDSFAARAMAVLAVATSIDALVCYYRYLNRYVSILS